MMATGHRSSIIHTERAFSSTYTIQYNNKHNLICSAEAATWHAHTDICVRHMVPW